MQPLAGPSRWSIPQFCFLSDSTSRRAGASKNILGHSMALAIAAARGRIIENEKIMSKAELRAKLLKAMSLLNSATCTPCWLHGKPHLHAAKDCKGIAENWFIKGGAYNRFKSMFQTPKGQCYICATPLVSRHWITRRVAAGLTTCI